MTILHTHTGVYEDTHTHTRANLLWSGGVRERVGDSGGDYRSHRGSGAEGRPRGARWRGSRASIGRWLRRQQQLLKGEREGQSQHPQDHPTLSSKATAMKTLKGEAA